MNTNSSSSSSRREAVPIVMGRSGSGCGQCQRKKRLKLTRLPPASAPAIPTSSLKPRVARKKPDASAAKIIRPACSECGRRFWSWKALFGHMRCHPERQWRGINPPPPNFHQAVCTEIPSPSPLAQLAEDDHEVATCLLMLSNGCTACDASGLWVRQCNPKLGDSDAEPFGMGGINKTYLKTLDCRFECSSCMRTFGSHQELVVHSASHKNVRGDFDVVSNDGEEDDNEKSSVEGGKVRENEEEKMVMIFGHKCSACWNVFSSGEALGGHRMRCHWKKGDEHGASSSSTRGSALDLNLPAPQENEDSPDDLFGTKAGDF